MDIDAYAERNLSVAARKKLATILQQELYIILQVVSCCKFPIYRKLERIWNIAGGANSPLAILKGYYTFIILMYGVEINCDLESIGIQK